MGKITWTDYDISEIFGGILTIHVNDIFIIGEGHKIDLDRPVIIGRDIFGKAENRREGNIMLDGHHRLRYAFIKGIQKLNCYTLNTVMTKKIRS